MKKEMEELRKENEMLKTKCGSYELALQGLEEKVESSVEREEVAVSETKLEEL